MSDITIWNLTIWNLSASWTWECGYALLQVFAMQDPWHTLLTSIHLTYTPICANQVLKGRPLTLGVPTALPTNQPESMIPLNGKNLLTVASKLILLATNVLFRQFQASLPVWACLISTADTSKTTFQIQHLSPTFFPPRRSKHKPSLSSQSHRTGAAQCESKIVEKTG